MGTPDLKTFLSAFSITQETFDRAGISWESLCEIARAHEAGRGDLQVDAEHIARRLQSVPAIHSLKWRVKDTQHLIAKIIRKRTEKPEVAFRAERYEDQVTDLIGLRALHLLKGQWEPIHRFVMDTWDLHEEPIAYVRKGDPAEGMSEAGLRVEEHPSNYRSVHYLIKFTPTRKPRIAELQVRTLFEEGWSEIDHTVRYPTGSDDPVLWQLVNIFNRLAGSADEMGTFVMQLRAWQQEKTREIDEAEQRLQKLVEDLKITREERRKLHDELERLKSAKHTAAAAAVSPLLDRAKLGLGSSLISPPVCKKCGALNFLGDSSDLCVTCQMKSSSAFGGIFQKQ